MNVRDALPDVVIHETRIRRRQILDSRLIDARVRIFIGSSKQPG